MTLSQKVGQLLMVHVYGHDAQTVDDDHARANERLYGATSPHEIITELQPGGVILIRRNPQDPEAPDLPTANLESLDQIRALTTALQDAAATDLLIATDQEQGPIRRLPEPASALLGGAELGATRDTELAFEVARVTGRELLDVGINQNLAPVADVNTVDSNPAIGDRSFGSDPALVSEMVAAQVRGYQDAGVLTTAKHFPGHGAATADSHLQLPVVDASRQEWRDIHEPPFRAAIDAGVHAIMTAHLEAPALGTDGPATLSPAVTRRLRRDLAFEGVIMTDSLWMRGVRDSESSDVEIALTALDAGHDLLLMPPSAIEVRDAIILAVEDGRISEVEIDARVQRILQMKQTLGLLR